MFSGFYTTNKGHNYIAKSMGGKTLVLTRGQYGDGTLPDGAVITEMTALVSPLADMQISKQNTSNNCIITTTQFSNRVGGIILPPFHLMEVGIFGKLKNADGTDDAENPEVLLFYTYELSKEKADYIPGILTEFLINWPLTISGSENITVEISDSLVYLTKEEFNELNQVIVKTGGSGAVYTATVPLMTELEVGKKITIIPHVNSTTANVKINVNGLGEKFIRQELSTNTGATAPGYTDGWILKGKPLTLTYNGTYWVADITRPDANTIYGTTKIENGGTGASTLEGAQDNLGITDLLLRPVNNNILINANFANPVNQRGYNGAVTTKSDYTIDRWKVNAGQSFVVGSNGIIFNAASSTCYFLQRVEAKNVEGKVVTFSSKINGKIYSLTANLSADATNENLSLDEKITMNISYTKGSESCTVSVVIKPGATPTIEWAKLEVGEHATPYVPRLFSEELHLCKRYYYTTYSPLGGTGYLGGISENGQSIALVVEFPVEMRAKPTVTVKSPTDGSVGYVAEWTAVKNAGNGVMIASGVTNKQFFVTSVNPQLTKGVAYYFAYEADSEL